MKIKATETFKDYRYMCLPKGLSVEQFRTLRDGEVVDVKDKSVVDTFEAQGLITIIKNKDEVKQNGDDAL